MTGEQHAPTPTAMEPRVPLAEHSTRVSVPMVPFGPAGVPEQAATADYFDGAARRIAGGSAIGGYNVTSTVVALLHRTADALRAPEVRALPDREAIAPMTEAMEELVVWAACQQAPDDTIPARTESEARRRWHAWLAARDAYARAALDRDVLEQTMFKHQPVMSMRDGSIAGCQCMDRVFTGSEDWGTHLADAVLALFGQEGQR